MKLIDLLNESKIVRLNEVKDEIEILKKKLKQVKGNTPAAQGKRAAIQDDIDRLMSESKINEVRLNERMKPIEKFELTEGVMSDIHKMAGRVKDEEEFVKKFFKKYGDKVKKNPKSVEWVKSLYTEMGLDYTFNVDKSVNEAGDFAGWIAFYNGKRLEIKKSEANGIYGAKQIAIKKLKVPKSKQGLLAIKPAVEESVNEGKKRFYQQDGIGKAKYTISYHDGKQKHKDGSDFYGIEIFRNQKDLEKFRTALLKKGYREDSGYKKESVNEAMGNVDFKDGLVDYIGDNPKLDKAYNSMKNPKDFMKLLITTMRNDKKAKKLYSYFSKNRTKGALDIIQKLASGDI